MTVAIKSPETILEVNKHLGVNFEVYGNGDPEMLTYEINGKQYVIVPAFEDGGRKIYSFSLE